MRSEVTQLFFYYIINYELLKISLMVYYSVQFIFHFFSVSISNPSTSS